MNEPRFNVARWLQDGRLQRTPDWYTTRGAAYRRARLRNKDDRLGRHDSTRFFVSEYPPPS